MSTTYERLVAAGAPAIVEPLFYRIREIGEGTSLRLEVRHRRPRLGSRLLVARSVAKTEADVLAALVAVAVEAMAALDSDLAAYELVGDHSSAAGK